MAATFGKLEEFDTATGEDWIQYVERMEYYFQANGITEADTKRAVLISAMGGKAYKLMRNLISPAKPKDKSFEQLVETMKKHFCPPPSEIVQRYKFNSRVRQDRESVAVYVSELRALAQYCNFGETLEVMLRDRIVCGVNDQQTQKKLLAEKTLSFDRAMEIALAVESATKGTRDITSGMCDNAPPYRLFQTRHPQWLILNVFTVAGVTTSQQNVISKMQPVTDVTRKAT